MRRRKKREQTVETAYREAAATGEDMAERFLPAELLERMGIGGEHRPPAELLAEQKEWQAVILYENIAGFQELIHNKEIREIYRLINRTLSFSIPAIQANRGIVDSFEDAGVAAQFTEKAEDGIRAAVFICEEMIRSGEMQDYRDFAVGLCYGTVMAGVVGYGNRMSVLTLSIYTGLGRFLQRTAPKYYARILATGSYTERIDGFEKKYNHRLLGMFYIRGTDSMEKVIDIFDGDQTEVRNRKRKTRMLFEKGVRLFLTEKFGEARSYFIEVLKADHDDRAAREYVFLCDRYQRYPPSTERDLCIESY